MTLSPGYAPCLGVHRRAWPPRFPYERAYLPSPAQDRRPSAFMVIVREIRYGHANGGDD